MDIREIVVQRMTHFDTTARRKTALANPIQKLTANTLAAWANVPPRTVYDFVNGKSINIEALGRILDALGLTIVAPDQQNGDG